MPVQDGVELARHRVTPLPLDEASAAHLPKLPDIHRDPFDRTLAAQAAGLGP